MGLIDNQKLQKGVATLLGVADESDQATKIARQWAEDNEYSDSEEDTLRHILLGGFMQSVQGEGFGRMGKEIAGKLINKRESTDKESLIDVANNNFGRQLRKELINKDKDNSVEGFVEAAKNFVHNLRTEKEVRDVDGLRPKMSTAGQEKQIDMAKGGVVLMDKQMELFAGGGLKDEGGSVDKESGNKVPVGSLKEEVRDDIDAKLSEGEFVLPADVVRFYGLAHIMKMRDVAKAGLAKMDAMGQMGNSDQATMEDDMPFSMEDLEVEDEEGNSMAYADGGYVRNFEVGGYNPATGTTTTGNTGISYMPASTFGTPVAPVTPVNPTVNTTMPQYNLQAAPQGGFTYKMPEGFTTPVLPKQQDVLGTKDGLPPSTKMGKYTNAAGETMEIPLDGLGNPLYDVPVGYTRVDEAPAAPAPVAPSIEAPTAPTQKNDGDNDNVPEQKPKSIKWDNLNYDELVKVGTEITSPAAKTAMAIFSAIPVIGGFAAMAGANQNKKLRTAIQNEFLNPTTASDPAKLEQLNTLWDNSKSFLGTLLGTNKQTLAESMAAAKLKDPKLKYNAPAAKAQVSAVQTVANAAIAKLLAGSNGGYVADQLDRGYIGSTIGGVAIGPDGKVVSLDKNGKPTGAGVVATADGKVMRDPDTNRTVYADSQGNMYTSGLFGMNKKNLDGTAYKGPGDAKTAPVTNTVAAQPAPKPALTISGGSGTQKQVIASKDKDYSDNTSNWGNASAATVSAAKSGTGAFSSGAASKTQSKSINKSKATKGYKGGRAKGGLMTKKEGK
jgi:hypothetical protein